MNIICFPFERVIEINAFILSTEKGMKGAADIGKLQGALGRVDNAIMYEGLDDVFEIGLALPLHMLCLMPINVQD